VRVYAATVEEDIISLRSGIDRRPELRWNALSLELFLVPLKAAIPHFEPPGNERKIGWTMYQGSSGDPTHLRELRLSLVVLAWIAATNSLLLIN
jgi:hypothetical protein